MSSKQVPTALSGWRKAIQPFASYRNLPRIAGAWFLPIALLARLPIAMLPLGTLGLVTAKTGSVGTAGIAAGAISVGAAIGGPVIGQLADRHGQRIVLLIAGPLNAAAIAGTVLLTELSIPLPVLIAAFFVTGCTVPQVSPLARVRWMSLTSAKPSDMGAALSYESTIDEITFVLGPAAVGLLAALGGAHLPLLTSAVITTVFVVAFALHPTSRLGRSSVSIPIPERDITVGGEDSENFPHTRENEPERFADMPARDTSFGGVLLAVLVPTLGMAAMGMFFGGSQASVTAFAKAADQESIAGLLYAIMGIGSAITALALVMVPEKISLQVRWIVLAGGQALAALLLPQAESIGALALSLALVGLFVGPTMVTVFAVGTARAPRGREGVAMTLLQSANVVGVAIGSALAGIVADSHGASVAYYVPVAASILLLLVQVITYFTDRKKTPGQNVATRNVAGTA